MSQGSTLSICYMTYARIVKLTNFGLWAAYGGASIMGYTTKWLAPVVMLHNLFTFAYLAEPTDHSMIYQHFQNDVDAPFQAVLSPSQLYVQWTWQTLSGGCSRCSVTILKPKASAKFV